MERIKDYLLRNFEQVLVLIILVSAILINYFIPYKIAFLNFYYLPIMASGYLLGRKASIMGSLLCILLVTILAILSPRSFSMEEGNLNIALSIATWGSFLLLAGIIVGTLQERLVKEYHYISQLNGELQKNQRKLENVNLELKESNQILKEKTEELEEKKRTIEILKDKVENALYSTMDSTVAKLVVQERLRNEKKIISVLFSDLVGFTTFSDENRPETVIEGLNKFLEIMEPVIASYRGHIDKYIGDGIMCEFGAPIGYETHSLLAVLAGIKMLDKLHKSDLPWDMRIGIGTGHTITGLIGFQRQAYTAIGDAVNVASRLEEISPPGNIFIDEETYQQVKDFIKLERVRSFARKRSEDSVLLEEIRANEELLKTNPKDIKTLAETGKMYFELTELYKAIEYFERALALEPYNTEIKLLYADASLKKDTYEKIEIKGKRERVSVYKVIGIKDILQDNKKIPDGFYQKYKYVEDLIEIPEDVILPVEALDGTIGHSKAVAIISYAIADQLGLTEQEKRNILLAGYLEDIGKQIVPHYILNRHGSLTEMEIKEMEKHPMESTKILKSMGYDIPEVLEIVLHHHEMYNGEGYPYKKRGEEIPLGARITGVADNYSALVSWRSYREGWESEAALAEIRRGGGRGKFDPQISDILIEFFANYK